MRIQTNLAAYSTQAKLSINSNKKSKSIEKLSSGQRLNRSADDAAGISISEKMRAQIRGMNRASANVQDGVSLIGVADGALQEVTNMMHRIRELSVQAASDTNAQIDRNAIQTEVNDLISEINNQLGGTNFNGIPLFDGSNVGTYEYAYGLTNTPTVTPSDPAYIIADAPFEATAADPLVIMSGAPAVVSLSPSDTFLYDLNNPSPTFPKQGLFTIRVEIPGSPNTIRNATLDFGALNTSGNFNLDDFRSFYESKFSDLIDDGKLIFNIGDDGSVDIKTAGPVGGSDAKITFGYTGYIPSGATLANSAILGASDTGDMFDMGIKTTKKVDQAGAIALESADDETLWQLLPHPLNFTYYIGAPHFDDSLVQVSTDTLSFADFKNFLATNLKPEYFTLDLTGLEPTFDRDGTVYISFVPDRYINPTPPHNGYYSTDHHKLFETARDNAAKTVSDFPAAASDNSGILSVKIHEIPGIGSVEVVVDFSEKKATMNGQEASFSDTASMVKAIEDLLNAPANKPYPTPTIVRDDYDPAKPIARVTIDAENKLCIETAEGAFKVSVTESQSDRPMFFDYTSAVSGSSAPHVLHIDGTPNADVTIAPGEYTGIDDFIAKNAAAFLPSYILKTNDAGTSLVIQSSATGAGVDVRDLAFISPTPTSPTDLLARLGYKNIVTDTMPMFQDGVSYPTQVVQPSGLWIQGGANLDEGLFICIPRLDAYDLGLMIRLEDFLAPSGSHRADGGVEGDNSIAGTGGVNMGTASYTTEANIEPTPLGHGLDVSTREKASAAISITDNAINIMNKERAQLGATQNRLGFMNANLNINAENLTAAESRIRDADMAKEMTNLVRNGILSQGSTAMLSISNNFPQAVLQLLG